MIKDPTIYLIAQELHRLSSLDVSQQGQEYERYEFQAHLERIASEQQPKPNWEAIIVQKYLSLGKQDLQELSPELHLWFLEQVCLNAKNITRKEVMRLILLYFRLEDSLCRYYVVNAMLGASRPQTGWMKLWLKRNEKEQFARREDSTSSVQNELAEILLDIRSDEALDALDQLSKSSSKLATDLQSRIQFVLTPCQKSILDVEGEQRGNRDSDGEGSNFGG